MRSESYSRLPDDIKKIFDEEWAKLPQLNIDLFRPWLKDVYEHILPEANVKLIKATDEEKARLAEYSRPVWDEWVAAREKEGIAGARSILNKMLELNGIK
jgi:TRAP-type C4-dicarboxylate transport system substrate-binding protein